MGESSGGSGGKKQGGGPAAQAASSEKRAQAGLSFDPKRTAVVPRDAATVIVLRRAAVDVEVFCVQRNPRSAFMGGAVVFPGGKVDEADGDPKFAQFVASQPQTRARLMAAGPAEAQAIAIAAARETLEEAGLLPTSAPAGRVTAARAALEAGQDARPEEPRTFLQAVEHHDLPLELDRLVPFARWVTPEAEPRRFDARFFLMALPDGQDAECCRTETTMGFWASPVEVLARFHGGQIQLAPPTTRCLELLSPARTLEEAFAIAERQSLLPICPLFVPGDPPMLTLAGDPTHEVRERRVDGSTRFVLRDGKFVSEPA